MTDLDFRAGDVLEISCPFTETIVNGVSLAHVSVRWPWWRRDPDSKGMIWDGDVAIDRRTAPDAGGLFCTEPSADVLKPGSACRVGIPVTIVHVTQVQWFDPLLETGYLPRPNREIGVLRQGVSEDRHMLEQEAFLNPDDEIPYRIKRLFRPYAFVEIGDEMADSLGRAWHFSGVWEIGALDGQGGVPGWPLALLADRHGVAGSERCERVAAGTRTGSHESEIDRWRDAAQAEPPHR
ncbi:hypothetical protein [Kineosporia babensis]|uniref:Uncharacterized protein n=1 Tax=Kineosporia babensis TaxID=499548 RepID=A0A9X1NCB8_9ACTN|nr:hypothetical protein [Kineosporia babensis]MCD5312337.1 hypothetical protein [Kineosporia babensis]